MLNTTDWAIKLGGKSSEYKEAVRVRLEELGLKPYSTDTIKGHKYIFQDETDVSRGQYSGGYCTNNLITLDDLYSDDFIKDKEVEVNWVRVFVHKKGKAKPEGQGYFKNVDEFYEARGTTSDHYHWVKATPFHSYTYQAGDL